MADATESVIDLAEMRRKLRPPPPPETFVNSITRTSANIDAAFATTSRRVPTDG
jgi:hypothetical protein